MSKICIQCNPSFWKDHPKKWQKQFKRWVCPQSRIHLHGIMKRICLFAFNAEGWSVIPQDKALSMVASNTVDRISIKLQHWNEQFHSPVDVCLSWEWSCCCRLLLNFDLAPCWGFWNWKLHSSSPAVDCHLLSHFLWPAIVKKKSYWNIRQPSIKATT